MNRINILKVADAIENASLIERDIGFNMSYWAAAPTKNHPDLLDNCGTICCIAGTAYAIANPELTGSNIRQKLDDSNLDIKVEAALFLDIDWWITRNLFMPTFVVDWNEIPPQRAVAVLRNLAETGEVDWGVGV